MFEEKNRTSGLAGRFITRVQVTVGAAALAALFGAGPAAAAPATQAEAERRLNRAAVEPAAQYGSGEILVQLTPGVPAQAALTRAVRRVRGRRIKSFPAIGVELWRIGPDWKVDDATRELARSEFRDAIEFAEPNWHVRAHDLPSDSDFSGLWGMHNVGQTGGTPDADIDAPEAWDIQTGSQAVVIAVIDSGVDYLHEDLAANIWSNGAEVPGNGLDDDGNGYVDDVMGWDFVNDDNDPMDDYGHGTHTAGTIGAVGDNGIGVAGVNWSVRLMPLKFFDSRGRGTTADAIEAILYAASFEDGAGNKVVRFTNNSWGGGHRSNALKNAIQQAGGLFIASAGNSGSSHKQFPADFGLENILSVAATDHDDQLAGFSSYGSG